MNAPVLWILIPFLTGAFSLLFLRRRFVPLAAGTISALLSLAALIFPIDTALLLGSFSLKIAPSIQFFGRSFAFSAADGSLIAVIYGLAALWFFGTEASGSPNRFVSLGLMIVALLTASIAVEPFLFAALLLTMAAMLVIPLLVPLYQSPGRGVVRFLIYQTLAMPFILFSGWMLAGVEAGPGEVGATLQAGTVLLLGFAFLLGVFPLYNWIPMLMEETSPYVTGFLLWALPVFTVIFALDFLDRYTWLRASPQLSSAIQLAGVIMTASGGLFAFQEKHIGRIMGYAAVAETGLFALAMGLKSAEVVNIVFLLVIPRGLELAVWALALSIIKRRVYSLQFSGLKGMARKYPLTVAALLLAHLSVTGFPLLAGFPPRLALWQELAGQSLTIPLWVFFGLLGLLAAAMRTMAVFFMAEEDKTWAWNETWVQTAMLGIGVAGLFVLGMFPQVMQPFIASLPSLFEHLGQ
jgi:formate hydrogenlyase subunit 3/multisubunit Na+/H+ antiporter MnhD subunit